MATEIDKRVVEMQFDNKEFEKNCKESLTTLEKLKMALNFDGAKGLESMGKAASKVDFSNLSKGADAVSVKFSAMQIAGVTAIQEITRGLMNFGKNIWDSTFGQIKSGGMARTLKIEQAVFQMKALANNVEEVKKGLMDADKLIENMRDSIDKAVTGTAYGYDAAAAVAAQLMASGLTDATKMYDHLRAIAGAAAMTGRSFEDIGNIFTTVASNGRLMTMQLRQFSAAGLNLSATLAQNLGKTEAEINEMVTKGQITFEMFSKALQDAFGDAAGKADDTFSGVTSNIKAQLSRIGQKFTDPFVENVIPFLKEVKARIKDVNTALDPMAKTWKFFFEIVSKMATDLMKNLKVGRLRSFFNGITNILTALVEIIWTIGKAIREVFPRKVNEQIYEGVKGFEKLTQSLIPTKKSLESFKQIVKALLIPLKLLWTVGVAVVKYAITPMLKIFISFLSVVVKIGEALKPIVDALLEFVTNGDFVSNVLIIIVSTLVNLADILLTILDCVIDLVAKVTNSGTFGKILQFLGTVGNLLANVILISLSFIFDIINDILSVINSDRIQKFFDTIIDAFNFALGVLITIYATFTEWIKKISEGDTIFADILKFLKEAWSLVKNLFSGNDISDNLSNLVDIAKSLGDHIKVAWDKFKEFLKGIDAGKIIVYAFAIVMVLLIFSIQNFVNALANVANAVTTGIKSLVELVGDIRNLLKGMLTMAPSLQLLLGITVVIWSLTASLLLLSKLEWNDLAKGGIVLGVLAGGILLLALALSKIKFAGFGSAMKMLPSIMALAVAILAITAATVILAKCNASLKQLIPAVLTVVLLMGILGAALVALQLTTVKITTVVNKRISSQEKALMVSANIIIAFSLAVSVLVIALIKVSQLKFKEAMIGLSTVAGLMLALAGAMAIINWSGAKFSSALGIALFIGSFILLLKTIAKLSELPFSDMANGLKNAGSVLAMIAVFFTITAIIGKKAGNVMVHNITSMFTSLTILIAAATATIFILKGMTTEEISKGMAVIILLGIMFTLIVKSLLKSLDAFGKNMKTFKDATILKSFSRFIMTFSVCLSLLAVAAIIANGIAPGSVAKISVLMLALAGSIAIVEWVSAHTKRAKIGVVIAFIVGLVSMMSMMAVLTLTDPDRLYAVSFAMMTIFGMMALLALALGHMAKTIDVTNKETNGEKGSIKNLGIFIAFILGMVGLITALVPLFNATKDVSTDNLTVTMGIIGSVMVFIIGLFAAMAFTADKIEKPGNLYALAGSVLMMATAFSIIIGAAALLATQMTDIDKAGRTLVSIGVLMLFFGLLVKSFSDLAEAVKDFDTKKILSLGGSIAIMTGLVAVIAGCITAMTLLTANVAPERVALSFGTILVTFYVVMKMFTEYMKSFDMYDSEESPAQVASSLVILMSTIAIIAGSITAMSLILKNVNPLTIVVSTIALLGSFLIIMKYFKDFLEDTKDYDEGQVRKSAITVVIVTSTLGIIAAAMTATAYILKDVAWYNQLASFGSIILIFIGVMAMFGKFLKETKNFNKKDILARAASIVIVTSCIAIIAASVALLVGIIGNDSNRMASAIAGFVGILIAFGVVCFALHQVNKRTQSAGKLAATAGAIVAASAALLVIATAISMLADLNVDDDFVKKMAALIIPFGILIALFAIVAAVGESLDPIAILAMGGGILAGSLAIVIIAQAVKTIVDATKNINAESLKKVKSIMDEFLIVLGILVVVGGIMGGLGMIGAGVLVGIGVIMASFIVFAKGVDILATATKKFTECIIQLNGLTIDYNTVKNNLKNGLTGAADAISESAPNIVEAMKNLVMLAILAIGSLAGVVAAVGMSFILAFMEGILAALPTILTIVSQIMKTIVDWLEQPGQMDLISSFFEKIGEMLVSIIGGALKGLFGELYNMTQDFLDKYHPENIRLQQATDEAHQKEVAKAQSKQIDQYMSYYAKQIGGSYGDPSDLLMVASNGTDYLSMNTWKGLIDGFNNVAEAARNAGDELTDTTINTAKELFENAPIELLANLDSAYGVINEDAEKLRGTMTKVDETIDELASSNTPESMNNLTKSTNEASTALTGMGEAAVNSTEKVEESAFDTEKAIEFLKDKFGNASDSFKNAVSNIDIKGTAKKLGVDSKKLGSLLGKITGISFGEEYEETMEFYMQDAMTKITNRNGEWQYKFTTFLDENGKQMYKTASEYAEAMMATSQADDEYAITSLAEFFGISLDVNGALEDGSNILGDYADSIDGLSNSTDKATDKLKDFRDGVHDSIAQAMKGIFDEVSEQEYIDPEEMLYRMEENTRRVGEWARNIATLAARGMSEGLLNELKDMGPAGAAKVQAFVDMTDEQLEMANRRWRAADFLPDYGAQEIEQAYRNAGYNASLGFSDGVDLAGVKDTGIATGKAYDEGVREYLEIESPSQVMKENGEYTAEGLAIGLTDAKSMMLIKTQTTLLAKTLVNNLQYQLKPDIFIKIGENVTAGLNSGLSYNMQSILSKITAFAANIINTFQRILRIKSPSKAMEEIGAYTMEGFGVGFEEGADQVEKLSENSANDILNQMKEQIAAITNGWSEDNVYEPVIRPVFDMTSIDQGYNDIQSWFANSQGISLNGSISRLTPTRNDDTLQNQMLLDAIKNINNDDVVDEIVNLRNDISNLQSAMTNLQVVMNTGALVGQLVDPMDSALGAKSLMNSRGRY